MLSESKAPLRSANEESEVIGECRSVRGGGAGGWGSYRPRAGAPGMRLSKGGMLTDF